MMIKPKFAALLWILWNIYQRRALSKRAEEIYEQVWNYYYGLILLGAYSLGVAYVCITMMQCDVLLANAVLTICCASPIYHMDGQIEFVWIDELQNYKTKRYSCCKL